MAALESVYSFFEEPENDNRKRKRVDWNWFLMLIYTLIYTSIILYTYEYFEGKFSKFCSTKLPTNSLINGIWEDFKRIVLKIFLKEFLKGILKEILKELLKEFLKEF